MNVINKFYVNVRKIPNGLEKYMAFTIYKNLVFIDIKQFLNSSLEKLPKNLLDNDFEYLSEEFNPKPLKLVKQKRASLINTWEHLKNCVKINYLIKTLL